jgi:hypothetical protein
VGQDRGEQAGDLHLGHSDLLGDLGLRHVGVEPHQQNAALVFGKRIQQRSQGMDVGEPIETAVRVPEALG